MQKKIISSIITLAWTILHDFQRSMVQVLRLEPLTQPPYPNKCDVMTIAPSSFLDSLTGCLQKMLRVPHSRHHVFPCAFTCLWVGAFQLWQLAIANCSGGPCWGMLRQRCRSLYCQWISSTHFQAQYLNFGNKLSKPFMHHLSAEARCTKSIQNQSTWCCWRTLNVTTAGLWHAAAAQVYRQNAYAATPIISE